MPRNNASTQEISRNSKRQCTFQRRLFLPGNTFMKIQRIMQVACIAVAGAVLAGCLHTGEKPLHYLGETELKYYRDYVTDVDFSDTHQPTAEEVSVTDAPRRIRHPRQEEIWDLSLAEALHLALANNEIIRSSAQFLNPGNGLLLNPNGTPSVYDVGIQETGILFGGRGVEAALSDFDTTFTTSSVWGRNEVVQNNPLFGLALGAERVDETAQFNSRLEKNFSYGANFAIVNNWNYVGNNIPSQLFPSVYQGLLQAEYRQPLWAARGPEYTRIAGPGGRVLQEITSVSQGVAIARINADITIADFEQTVHSLMKDTEDLYWDLYLAYRTYDAQIVARNSALRTWREVKVRRVEGLPEGGEADEAQARDNYFESRARAENALADIFAFETRLRRLLGLPVNDGRVLRPKDEPVTAEFLPDWHFSLAEALTRRVELRKQKWNIKSLELQLQAAKSLTNPRLDFVSRYGVNAFGDRLFGEQDNDDLTEQGLRSGFETLTQGNQTTWNLGFEFSMPLGFRQSRSQVRHFELRLAKARAALAAQELEISHELSNAFQSLDRWYSVAQTNFNRTRAAARRVQAFDAQFEAGQTTLDLLLRAQISRAQAEIAYYQALVDYNKSIADLHFRKGTILELDNVHLAEGTWEPEAYQQALRRAWERSFAFDAKSKYAEPAEFAGEAPLGDINLLMPPVPGGLTPMPGSVIPPQPLPYEQEAPQTPGDATPPPAGPAEPLPPNPADPFTPQPADPNVTGREPPGYSRINGVPAGPAGRPFNPIPDFPAGTVETGTGNGPLNGVNASPLVPIPEVDEPPSEFREQSLEEIPESDDGTPEWEQ
jgi:outer membrane protein TolC